MFMHCEPADNFASIKAKAGKLLDIEPGQMGLFATQDKVRGAGIQGAPRGIEAGVTEDHEALKPSFSRLSRRAIPSTSARAQARTASVGCPPVCRPGEGAGGLGDDRRSGNRQRPSAVRRKERR